jgi:hypothetical protein
MGTSLISAFISAQIGRFQLAVAARLSRTDPSNLDSGASVTKLVDAAQQSMEPLANVSASLGTHLDISC